jgi:hypothetical protein
VSQPADVKAAAQKWAEVWAGVAAQDVDAIGSARSVRAPWTSREGSQRRAAVGGSMMQSFALSPGRAKDRNIVPLWAAQ